MAPATRAMMMLSTEPRATASPIGCSDWPLEPPRVMSGLEDDDEVLWPPISWASEPTYRVKAFRNAAVTVAELAPGELQRRLDEGSLEELSGIGKVTATAIAEAVAGGVPSYLEKLYETAGPLAHGGKELRAALRGD